MSRNMFAPNAASSSSRSSASAPANGGRRSDRDYNGVSSGSGSHQQHQHQQQRFSIHDAFEEETDEAIRVYGSTVISTPVRSKHQPARSPDDVSIHVPDAR